MNRLSYDIGKPNRFDVVVFDREGQQPGIKRIIGLPGETVQIKNGSVYIDGEALKAENSLGDATIAGVAEYPVELGKDEYFLLGDNRESSEDSRFFRHWKYKTGKSHRTRLAAVSAIFQTWFRPVAGKDGDDYYEYTVVSRSYDQGKKGNAGRYQADRLSDRAGRRQSSFFQP